LISAPDKSSSRFLASVDSRDDAIVLHWKQRPPRTGQRTMWISLCRYVTLPWLEKRNWWLSRVATLKQRTKRTHTT
jgi:hypothetical protein